MIKQWLATYQSKTATEAEQALREIMQEIALAGLYRSGFLKKLLFMVEPRFEFLWIRSIFGRP